MGNREDGSMQKAKMQKLLLLALKIAVGSGVAIYIAELLELQYASAAGSIALLTLITTKWGTVKLSIARVLTFAFTVFIAFFTFSHGEAPWIGYGVFTFLSVMFAEMIGWRPTLSVNAVIGMHFLAERDFHLDFIWNEFLLVCIGISVAIVLNLFHDYKGQEKELIKNMRYTEQKLQEVLAEISMYLNNKAMKRSAWEDLHTLKEKIHTFIQDAYEYQDNTFYSHPGYYIDYFEMRMEQCHILENLHYEMKKIKKIPQQARIISQYLDYLKEYVVEVNAPVEQLERLHSLFEDMGKETLPESREEFENRAVLYHILMDIEDFVLAKKRFVNEMDPKVLERYWNKKTE